MNFIEGQCRWITLLIGASQLAFGSIGTACPFCSHAALTLSEQFHGADVAVLAQWRSVVTDADRVRGRTTFVLEQELRGKSDIRPNRQFLVPSCHAGESGDLFLVLGRRDEAGRLQWQSAVRTSRAAIDYLLRAPGVDQAAEARLAYFLEFLEDADSVIAEDAFGEFANADYREIVKLRERLPVDRLRSWIQSSATPPSRLGLYGILLGLCGTQSDAALLEEIIRRPAEGEFRLGLDGLIGGYLLLTGEKGLQVIEETKFRDRQIPFSETYAAIMAVRFLWTYGDGQIAPERLRRSLRLLLDHPDVVDLIIADLARWQDWEIQDRLLAMYGCGEFDYPAAKRAIIRYLIASRKQGDDRPVDRQPAHARQAVVHLQRLRGRDPKLVAEAEKFFFLVGPSSSAAESRVAKGRP